MFSLYFPRLFLLQTTPPPSRPIQQPPVTKKEEVSVTRETGEFIRIQSTGGWISFHCFTLSPLVRHLPVETSALTSDGMFFCVFLYLWSGQKNSLTYFLSALFRVFSQMDLPLRLFLHISLHKFRCFNSLRWKIDAVLPPWSRHVTQLTCGVTEGNVSDSTLRVAGFMFHERACLI